MLRPILFFVMISMVAQISALADESGKINVTPITIKKSITRPLKVTIPVPGILESLTMPVVAAEVDGQVASVAVEEGQRVEVGEVVAYLDDETYQIMLEKAQAEARRLEAHVKNHRLTVKRFKGLVKKKSSSQTDLDRAETDLAATLAELAAARAQVKDARHQLKRTQIISPVSGKVQVRHVSTGDYVKVGDPTFQVVVTDKLAARLYIAGSLTGHIRIGQPVKMKIGAQPIFVDAKITRLPPMLNPGNRALEALVDFDNPGDWQPGNGVVAIITLDTRPNAILVPTLSLVRRPDGMVVYRIKEYKATQQIVKIGRRDGEWTEIISGLEADETIAYDGAGFLTDKANIEIRNQ